MVQIPIWSAILVALFGFQNPEDSVLHRSSTLKILETQHLRIFYTGEFLQSAKVIGHRGDRFLNDLEERWGIVLPEERTTVSMIRVFPTGSWLDHDFDPPWLASAYSHERNRVELRAKTKEYRDDPAFKSLKHHLIHALLNRGLTQPFPQFMEEGMARYYAGSRGSRQVYLAVLAFQRAENLAPFLNNPHTYQVAQDFQYAGAVGFQWVKWLWEKYPRAEKRLIQAHLEGKSFDQALDEAGLPPFDELLETFETEMRPRFGLTRLLKTYDFWLLGISLLVLIAAVAKVIAAIHHARSSFVEMEPAPEEVPADLFQGPAFNPIANAPQVSPRKSFTPVQALPELPQPGRRSREAAPDGYDDVVIPPMEDVFQPRESVNGLAGLELNTDDLDVLDDQLDEVFDRIGLPKDEPSIEPSRQKAANDRKPPSKKEEPDKEIDSEVDSFFDRIS